ncbi:hypothetical protein BDN72DRAFT_963962 [Pluteus cervinus]|uniref:Uncharacterized protein n=1 Tax=Pluteus cervinus TaxID=181527 RepID=A0ACD3ACA6_9AGAR|nr:hypothetical protein BDN72DRAFT_963962 [Pluteus cervinus]
MSLDYPIVNLLHTEAKSIRLTQYFTLASSTLYLYDLLLTIHLEVDLLWPSKWTFIKVAYLLQRYLPLVDMVVVTIMYDSPLPIPGLYCFSIGIIGTGVSYPGWVLLTVYDLGLLVLITTRAFRAYNSSHDLHQKTLSQVVYRDGVLYYLYLVGLSAINIVLNLMIPTHLPNLLITSLERVLYSILTSHVVLHIREQAYRTQVVMTSPDSVDGNAEAEFRRSEI